MPDPNLFLRMLGIVPRQESGSYGLYNRPNLGLNIPDKATQALGMDPRSLAPLTALEAITDFIEPQKGLAKAAMDPSVMAKMAALLGIGVPKRFDNFPGQIDIPLKVSGKDGREMMTTANIYDPGDESEVAKLELLGDLGTSQRLREYGPEGSKRISAQSNTTGVLGHKGLRQVLEYIADFLPDKQFLSYNRAGGIKGFGSGGDASIGADLQALREGKTFKDVIMRPRGTKKRAMTDREKQFMRQNPDSYSYSELDDLDDFTSEFDEVNRYLTGGADLEADLGRIADYQVPKRKR